MKNTFLLIALVLMVGCGDPRHSVESDKSLQGYHVIIIDGCEYLESGAPPRDWTTLTHKGNCKNPEHSPSRFSKIERTIDTSIAENKFFRFADTAAALYSTPKK